MWLKESAYNAILVEAIKQMPFETGGVLIGYWGNAQEVVITSIIGPGPKAAHKRHSFQPDQNFHLKGIAKAYLKSGRTETYLGDWHTHPLYGAYLSNTDKSTLFKIADFEQARLSKPIMMVLGTKPYSLEAWVHVLRKSRFFNKRVLLKCQIKLYQ